MESDSKITFRPLPEDDPNIRQPDITLAREKLGWEPRVNRHDGLQHVIQKLTQNSMNTAVQHP